MVSKGIMVETRLIASLQSKNLSLRIISRKDFDNYLSKNPQRLHVERLIFGEIIERCFQLDAHSASLQKLIDDIVQAWW